MYMSQIMYNLYKKYLDSYKLFSVVSAAFQPPVYIIVMQHIFFWIFFLVYFRL